MCVSLCEREGGRKEQNKVTKGRKNHTQVWNPFHKQMQKCIGSHELTSRVGGPNTARS